MLEAGLYDELATEALAESLTDAALTSAVDAADAPTRLAEPVGRVLHREFPRASAVPSAAARASPAASSSTYQDHGIDAARRFGARRGAAASTEKGQDFAIDRAPQGHDRG